MPANADSPPPELSLYLHAPYCRARCHYCAFSSRPVAAAGTGGMGAYIATLLDEIALWGQHLGASGPTLAPPAIATIFFGGGTPSLLPPEGLLAILDALRRHFALAPGVEITMEANPESATPELLRAARTGGVNRLSLGVQSLDDAQLALLGRPHTAAEAARAVQDARDAGFDNLGLDLIWGLPGQTPEHWLRTLRAALDLGPDHLSCYGLSLEPGTPLALAAVDADSGLPPLPGEEALERMYLEGGTLLDAAGFEHYEISNHARPGRRCQHNLLCWQGRNYLGLGPAAVSTICARTLSSHTLSALPVPRADTAHGADGSGSMRWTNPEDPALWAAAVRAGRIGPGHSPSPEALSAGQLRREGLMLGLRTCLGAPLSELAGHEEFLRTLLDRRLATSDGTRLRLTRAGMLLSNSIIEALVFE